MRTTAILAIVALLGLAGTLVLPHGTRGRAAAVEAREIWSEVSWPFPMDQWGKGKAFVCTAAECGSEVTIYDPAIPGESMPTMRGGGRRVLNLNTGGATADLLGALAQALGCGGDAIGPANFALQMVKGPEEITFSATPPPRPS